MRFYKGLLSNSTLAALAVGVLLSSGCQSNVDNNTIPPLATPDTPTTLPVTPALFMTTGTSTVLPEKQVESSTLPSRPPDAAQVARQADVPASAPETVSAKDVGLIVWDPISTSPDLKVFGMGCGRCLDLAAAGQPELGRTPLWESRDRVAQELGRTDMCLTQAQAKKAGAMTGAGYAACGTIHGTAAQCTLTYTLYNLQNGKPVGLAIEKTGSRDQIVSALPAVAKMLDTRLDVAVPCIPTGVGLSPDELVQVINIRREPYASDADLSTLAGLSARSPLAGMYYLNTRAAGDQVLLNGMVKVMQAQLPENALVISHIAYAEPGELRPYAAQTKSLTSKYPQSALLAHTEVWLQRQWGNRATELQAAQRFTADAPLDPESWLSRGATLGNISEDLRQSRVITDISDSDMAVLEHLYAERESADQQATKLDPLDGHAWIDLSEATTFSGDSGIASDALTKALALDPDKAEVYAWALQMNQSKWGGDTTRLTRIAGLATSEPWTDPYAVAKIVSNLESADFKTQAAQVLTGFIARERAQAAKTPTDALAHWDLAAALAEEGTTNDLREASLEYRVAEHLIPNSPTIYNLLAHVLDHRNRGLEAIGEYQKAIALYPFDSSVHFALGYDLKEERKFDQATSELKLAILLDPHNSDAHAGLGDLYIMQHDYKAAASEYQEAIRMNFYHLDARLRLPDALDEVGDYDASLQAGMEAENVFSLMRQSDGEAETHIHDTMSDDYLHKKEWNESMGESNTSLSYNQKDPVAHENLAEADFGAGRKSKARTEWQQVVAMGNLEVTPVAQKFLAENP